MKKCVVIVFAIIIILVISACSGPAVGSGTAGQDTTISMPDNYETTMPVNTEESTEQVQLKDVDIFENVEVVFDGWNDLGIAVSVETDKCDDFIKSSVVFSFENKYADLANGETVTVVAEYDSDDFTERGLRVVSDRKSYTVQGLREIAGGQDFHDGVAWVAIKTGPMDSSVQWCCCDKDGNVLFYLDEGLTPTTCFANGVAVVSHRMIVNKVGEVIWSVEEEGMEYANSVWGEGSVSYIHIPFDEEDEEYFGYSFVEFTIESYEFSGKITGVLDADGNWWSAPKNDGFYHGSYSGAGFYWCPSSYSDFDWYNVLGRYVLRGGSDSDQYDYYLEQKRLYDIEKHDGLIFQWDDYPDIAGFYNADGEKVIDLSNYILYEHAELVFNEGYALLELENEQGSRYYTVIDLEGNEMFAPKKAVEHGELRCGLYWVKGVGYMNVYGEVVIDWCVQGRTFSEGMALVRHIGIHYINTSGEIVF